LLSSVRWNKATFSVAAGC